MTLPRRLLGGAAGLLGGVLAGAVLALALVVVRATLEEIYLHDLPDLKSWWSLPVVLAPLAGAALGALGRLRAPLVGAALGAVAGAVAGGLLGSAVTDDPSGPWAGAVMGAGAGLSLGALLAALGVGGLVASLPPARLVGRGWSVTRERLRLGWEAAAVAAAVVAVVGGALFLASRPEEEPLPAAGAIAPPDSASVGAVILFVGDTGEGTAATLPVLSRIRRDVEAWSRRLGPGGRVVVVVLGDVIYPGGLRAPESEAWVRDSTRVAGQVGMVGGPAARQAGARAVFLAGNHDWGEEEDWGGAVRVLRLATLLDGWRAAGVDVALLPEAGSGGPAVVDVAGSVRLILLDTAWWLLGADASARETVLAGVEAAMEGADGRRVVVAAHHPFVSSGPHGGLVRFGETLGVRALLSRSGALLQDLRSHPYRRLRQGLLEVFGRTGPPVLFAGGHEHSLQVSRSRDPRAPGTVLVSGAASKLTGVSRGPETVFARSVPGYATLLVRRDGGLVLRVEAAPRRWLTCPDPGPSSIEGSACIAQGVAAYRTVWEGPL